MPCCAVTFITPMAGRGRPGNAGAAVAVGLRKIAHRRAADEIVLKVAVSDQLYRLRRNAFVVDT